MDKINFENLPSTNTPLDADTLNGMQSNIEKSVVAVGSTAPSTGENVWLKKGKNLFDKNNVLTGYRFGSDGALYADSDFSATNFIKVNSSTQYTVSWVIQIVQCVCYYDENKNFISRNGSEKTFTTPANCKYIRASVSNSGVNSAQIEQGSQTTTYEPYVGKKILVKNDNNIFEMFYEEPFEAGTNENGNYIKYSNGICIQYGKKDLTTGNTAYTSGGFTHYVTQVTYDLPIPFKDYYEIFANVSSANAVLVNLIYAETNADKSKFNLHFISSSANYSRTIHWLAIGRW